MRDDGLRGKHRAETGDAPYVLELDGRRLPERLDQQQVCVVDEYINARAIGSERSCDVTGLRQIAGQMGIAAAMLFNRSADCWRTAIAARKTDHVTARPCKGRGDLGAKAFGDAGDEKKRTGHQGQTQPRMLAMM